LKRNEGKGSKIFQSYKIKLSKRLNNLIGEFLEHIPNYNNIKFKSTTLPFENPFLINTNENTNESSTQFSIPNFLKKISYLNPEKQYEKIH
jgi:hypothetical protein